MDCDLQDRPEEIEALYLKAQEGFEMVFARRIDRKDTRMKRLSSGLFGRVLSWLVGVKFDETVANFSVSSQKAVRAYRMYRERDRAFFMIMRDIGFTCAFVDVDHGARYAGETSYSLRKLVSFATQVVVSTSTRPLHLSIRFGVIVAGLSIVYAVYLVARYFLVNAGIAGWTSLAVLISLFFGLLFIQLGIIGLYLGKTFEESKGRPLYHVAEYRNCVPGE
jgi:polyisoprenyl-phosphate glycosyltransferase